MSESESDQTHLYRRPNWPPFWRHAAVVLWSGFLGAVLVLLALLMGWDVIQHATEGPGFGLMGGAFLVGWLICALAGTMALSLAREPQRQIRSEDGEDL